MFHVEHQGYCGMAVGLFHMTMRREISAGEIPEMWKLDRGYEVECLPASAGSLRSPVWSGSSSRLVFAWFHGTEFLHFVFLPVDVALI